MIFHIYASLPEGSGKITWVVHQCSQRRLGLAASLSASEKEWMAILDSPVFLVVVQKGHTASGLKSGVSQYLGIIPIYLGKFCYISHTWNKINKAILGWFPLLTMIPGLGRSEVVIIYQILPGFMKLILPWFVNIPSYLDSLDATLHQSPPLAWTLKCRKRHATNLDDLAPYGGPRGPKDQARDVGCWHCWLLFQRSGKYINFDLKHVSALRCLHIFCGIPGYHHVIKPDLCGKPGILRIRSGWTRPGEFDVLFHSNVRLPTRGYAPGFAKGSTSDLDSKIAQVVVFALKKKRRFRKSKFLKLSDHIIPYHFPWNPRYIRYVNNITCPSCFSHQK